MTLFADVARAAHAAGICVLPPKQDGSKAPDVASWKQYQDRLPTQRELDHWYNNPHRAGIIYVCGRVSGGLESFDFDDQGSAWDAYQDLVEDNGLGDLWLRITTGYLERTPGAGYHVLFRSPHPAGADKLALRPKQPHEKKHARDDWQALIETKGEGGYVIVAPTNGAVHPDGGCYELLSGGVDTIAAITDEERESLLAVARMLDQKPRSVFGATSSSKGGIIQRPGDQYHTETTWEGLLSGYGWRVEKQRGSTTHWTRPGKDEGTSATTNHEGSDLLYVFTSSTALDPDRSYDRFGFYTVMEHDGDFQAAARALGEQGYGTPRATTNTSGSTGASAQAGGESNDHPWPVLDDAALYGLAGDVVRTIEPHTEGDPVAVLSNFLTMSGSAIGRSPHARVGAARHHTNLYAVHVGETARARKGTAHSEALRVVALADPYWKVRVQGGLSSGEGLIYAVRDPIYKPNKEGEMKLVDPGVEDKRLLAVESEFSSVLRVAGRDGNTLSELIRRAWDGDDLRTLTRAAPITATAPHISVLGHITISELLRELSETYQANGFANRNQFFCVRRSKELPHGGALPEAEVEALAVRLREVLDFSRRTSTVRRDAETDRVWEVVYSALTAARPGLLGAITARAEAQVLRLSVLYALLDCSREIRRPHLEAALALWQYAEDSARFIFGDATGDPVADRILSALRANGPMAQNELVDLFGRNVSATRLSAALEHLLHAGRVRSERVDSGGRPRTMWLVTP